MSARLRPPADVCEAPAGVCVTSEACLLQVRTSSRRQTPGQLKCARILSAPTRSLVGTNPGLWRVRLLVQDAGQ